MTRPLDSRTTRRQILQAGGAGALALYLASCGGNDESDAGGTS